MHIEPSTELYELFMAEHPTYWVRVWTKLQIENTGPYPTGWNAEMYRITGAVDVEEVLAWAREQEGWPEIFVESANANPPTALTISGFNAARSDERPPAEYISDPKRATELSALFP